MKLPRPKLVLLASAIAATFGGGCGDSSTLVVTPSRPSGSSTMAITAPAYGRHNYTVHRIDATAFPSGGSIDIEVTVAADSGTDASFDLFTPDQAIPTEGMPQGSLATAYNISKGATVHLRHKFTRGEIFTFAGEGNWLSTAGNQGTARYTVNVQ